MTRIDPAELREFVAGLVRRMGAPSDTAASVAASLVDADRRGHRSHGVLRVPIYARMVADGAIRPAARPEPDRRTDGTALVEGRSAFGQVVGRTAVDLGTSLARGEGCSVVGVRDATHLGRIGEWAEQAANDGVLFGAFVNHQGGGKTVAPAGSAQRRLGTNPIAFGVPTFDALPFPVVVDMATSQVAHGKIREREQTGDPVPAAWTTTGDGTPETDAARFEAGHGALLPLGGRDAGYKGFGLSFVTELVAGMVGDALTAGEADPDWTSNAAMFLFVDPTRFTTVADCERRVDAMAAHIRETEFSPDVPLGHGAAGEETLLPGESEYRTAERRTERGIPIADELADRLRTVAQELDAAETIPPALGE